MLRILFIWLGTYAILNSNLESENVLESFVFPTINVFYLLFLFKEFVRFLYLLSANGTGGSEVGLADLVLDVWSTLREDISEKYSGKFNYFGRISDIVEDLVVFIEIICVVVSCYNEIQLLIYLAD